MTLYFWNDNLVRFRIKVPVKPIVEVGLQDYLDMGGVIEWTEKTEWL